VHDLNNSFGDGSGKIVENVNLKLVQTFVQAAKFGSLRKAADALQRSPSAVSVQIKELEEQLGLQLFVRARQRVSLTPEGQELYETVGGSLASIDQVFATLRRRSEFRKGQVSIGCAPTLAAQGIGDVLRTYTKRYKESAVTLMEAPPNVGASLLRDGKTILYLGPPASELEEFVYEPLYRDMLVACVPTQFDDGQKTLQFVDLLEFPVIVLNRKTATRHLIERIAEKRNVTLNVRCEIENAYTGLALAQKGLGVALLPRIALGMGAFDSFRAVPLADEEAVRTVGITMLRRQVLHPNATNLVDLIKDNFEKVSREHGES